jgi:hypothetical protein
MANALQWNPMQTDGTGDDMANVTQRYAAAVIAKYQASLIFGNMIESLPAQPGTNGDNQIVEAHVTDEEMVRGVERTGSNQPHRRERQVLLDTAMRISDHYIDEIGKFTNYAADKNSALDAYALARTIDKRISAQIALGAREDAAPDGAEDDDTFDGGTQITADNAGTVGTAYPLSLSGSRELQDDFGEMRESFDTLNVPPGYRHAFVGTYLHRVLLQDRTLVSSDFQSMNDLLTAQLVMVEGWMVHPVNNWVGITTSSTTGENWSAYVQSRYQGDFHKTAALFLGAPDAVTQRTALGGIQPFGPDWIPDKHSWYYGAKVWQGAQWWRPEACGELVLQ